MDVEAPGYMTGTRRPTEKLPQRAGRGVTVRARISLGFAADLAVDRDGGAGMIRLCRRAFGRLMSIVLRERREHEGFEAGLALDRGIKGQHILD